MQSLNDIKITPILESLKLWKISDEEYFSSRFSNYISNSRLGLINPEQGGSAENFFNGFKNTYAACFELGTGVHEQSLQKELYEIVETVDKPTAKMGALADRLYKTWNGHIPTSEDICREAEIIDYYGGKLTKKRIDEVIEKCSNYWNERKRFERNYKGNKSLRFYDPKTREIILNCTKALEDNKRIQDILHPTGIITDPISEMEQAILLDVEVEVPGYDKFILKLKAKLDNYTIDTETNTLCVNDVKTIGKIVSEAPNNISRFHYNREFAVYGYLLRLCAEKFYDMKNPTMKGNYLFVSTIPGHYTKVIPVTQKMFAEGMQEFKYLMRLVAEAVATKEEYKDFGIWTL